eukprot:1226534-Amphidinium_carterae.1
MVPVVARPPATREFYVKRSNVERWGAQPGCPACQQIVRDVKVTFSHTQACRERIKAALEQEGDLRLEQHQAKRARADE